jgi:riboflavin kinase/FMN adenylyltransferase
LKVYNHISEFPKDRETCVTIGTFDGVHTGHRKILNRLIDSAKKNQYQSTLLTFFPHPRMVLQQNTGLKLINTMKEKKLILEETGLDNLIIHPFSKEFSRLTAQEYVKDVLVDQLNTKQVIIGYDHRFGRNRTADINDLKKYGQQYDFSVDKISKQEIDDVAISSTKIRESLESGDIQKANNYLKEPFFMTGKVIKGFGRGKGFGFPTANLFIEEDYKLIPNNGVYVSSSIINDQQYYGLTNIGTNPTVNGTKRSIETYFIDFDSDLYDKEISVSLLHKLRDEKKFDNVEVLKKAMQEDKKQALSFIRKNEKN